jgi:2-C-methyl-D-erythritol 4-phosphate cytidylyltransferase
VSKIYALIPAAGSGSRVRAAVPKQYLRIGGLPLLHFALRPLVRHPAIEQVFVVLAQGDTHYKQFDWSEFGARLEPLYCGGATRAASVFNGLLAARDMIAGSDWVVVHDAARPCLSSEALERLLVEAGSDEAGGLLAVPVSDTLKRAGRDLRVAGTEPREHLWLAQTPQMFRYRLLIEALRKADPEVVTDEACAIEGLGFKPRLVMGETRNLKVTFSEDLRVAERILQGRDGVVAPARESRTTARRRKRVPLRPAQPRRGGPGRR